MKDRNPWEEGSVSDRVPGVGLVFEQINSALAINVAFPIPVKKEIKSQPVLMNSICITDGNVTCSIATKLGSFWKAVISAGKSKT